MPVYSLGALNTAALVTPGVYVQKVPPALKPIWKFFWRQKAIACVPAHVRISIPMCFIAYAKPSKDSAK